MLKRPCKGWLGTAVLALMLAAGPSIKAETTDASATLAKYLAEGDEPAAEYQVAQADGVPQTTVGTTDEPQVGDGEIEMTLKDPEQDVLTRAAMEKLNADIGSLTFKNTDLADVIRFIGRKLDLNFIFDADVVRGNVTLTFRNVRVKDALDSILTAQKLALVPDRSGIFRIVPAASVGRQAVETRTDVVQLNWVPAADVAATMKPFLSANGKMEISEMRNVIIITDVPPNLENIKGLIERVDIAEQQVMIEARLVDINIQAIRQLGTQWTLAAPRAPTVSAPGNLGAIDQLGIINLLNQGLGINSGPNGASRLAFGGTVGILGRDYDLNAVFNVLESRDIVEVLANPRVSTLNNVEADIKIVQQIPYISSSNLVSGAGTSEQIEFQESGVDIKVRPSITPNKYVRMEILMNQKIFRGRVGSSSLDPPLIDERNAATNVIVPTGETAVLGGLRQIQNIEGSDGVPWLHRVPLLGWLFKNKNHDQSKTELVLMITPNIIEQELPFSEHEQELYRKIDDKWHIPDRFMDDVSNTGDKHASEIIGRR